MNNVNRQIAEFHAAARRRKAMVYAVAAVVLIALGVVVGIITFMAYEGGDPVPVKAIAGGAVLVVAGLSAAWGAYLLATGRINDIEHD